MALTQINREISVSSPLGADVLLFASMSGFEELSRLSEFQLKVLSEKADIAVNDILGKALTVSMDLPRGRKRHFNAYVTRFAATGREGRLSTYTLTLRPWLWMLTRSSNCRIFQEKSVLEIVRAVFEPYACADFDASALEWAGDVKLPYCVQYRESDFNFISRLFEQIGIYYFFSHSQGQHTMVLADSRAAHHPIDGYATVDYVPIDARSTRAGEDIVEWALGAEIQTAAVALKDFNFERVSASNPGGVMARLRSSRCDTHDQSSFENYDYPGLFTEQEAGQRLARSRVDVFDCQFETADGFAHSRGLFPGGLFTLAQHPVQAQNRQYLVTRAHYQLLYNGYETNAKPQADPICQCRFQAIPVSQQFRPQRLTSKPVVPGPQTAMVTGKSGEEIWTDKYGRIKVQFHWDLEGGNDEKSSCWIRVAQIWAGKNWGGMFIPRIGQEVVVEFLEGDPDRPMITGSVYNSDNMPPYTLPDHATRSTIKSRSSKNGDASNFNEIRLEDKKGSEQLFIHAEKNQDNRVKENSLEWVGKDRHLVVKGDRFEQVDGASHQMVTGACNQQVDGALSLKVAQDVHHKAGMKYGLDAGMDVHIKGGMNVVIEAGMSVTLKAGGGFIVVGPAGVSISGTPIQLNCGGSAGSGAGVSPQAPTAPQEADDGSQ